MTDVSEAEIAAANEVFRERTTIYIPNDILRAALTAAAHVREQESVVKPLTPEREAEFKIYTREYARWLAKNLKPWTAP